MPEKPSALGCPVAESVHILQSMMKCACLLEAMPEWKHMKYVLMS